MGPSLGKWRRLQQATNRRGTFTILAIDHRGPLRRSLADQVDPRELEHALASLGSVKPCTILLRILLYNPSPSP
jgi:tagatose-1,6-bisphosphate aldolase